MGTIHGGAPTELILYLKDQFSLRSFVETGTFTGRTSAWAASHFDQVATVESSETIYNQTVANLGHVPNINFLFGHSTELLKQIMPKLDSPTLFWIDSHWSGGDTYGKDDECPILEEIETLNASPFNHFVLIDDARMFTSPPPRPHRVEAWPPIDEVIGGIKAGPHEKYIAIFEDVIIAVPKAAQPIVAAWLQNASTHSEHETRKRNNQGRLRRGVDMVGQGFGLIAQSAWNKAKSFHSS